MDKKINLKNPLSLLSTGFGVGLSPVAPGTAGSFVAALIYLFAIDPFKDISNYFFYYSLFIFFSFFLGLIIYPRTTGTDKDPSYFVWDEFVGMWIASFPIALSSSTLMWLFFSFLLFRLFDIWKPWFIKSLNEKQGALWVMMDDVIAGLISSFLIFIFICC